MKIKGAFRFFKNIYIITTVFFFSRSLLLKPQAPAYTRVYIINVIISSLVGVNHRRVAERIFDFDPRTTRIYGAHETLPLRKTNDYSGNSITVGTGPVTDNRIETVNRNFWNFSASRLKCRSLLLFSQHTISLSNTSSSFTFSRTFNDFEYFTE